MIILLWIRKIYKALSADASPDAIAFAVFFGLTLGFVPLTSGVGLFLLTLLLIFRVQLSTAFLALALAKVIFLLGAWRLCTPIGYDLLEAQSLRGFWKWFLNLPIVAWLGLDAYKVLGGAIIGLLLGAALYFPIRMMVIGYRRYVHEKVSKNKFFKWLTNFWLIKGLRYVFIGAGINA